MGLQHIVQVIMNDQHNQACKATWGHLAPEKSRLYRGYILFAHTCYGETFVIDWKFENLDSSPWFYECLNDFIFECDTKDESIYKFTGTFCNYKFAGQVEELEYVNQKS